MQPPSTQIFGIIGKEAREQGNVWNMLRAGLFQGSLEWLKQAEALREEYEATIRKEFDHGGSSRTSFRAKDPNSGGILNPRRGR